MNSNPRNLLTYTKSILVEELVALDGRDRGPGYRRELESLSIEQLTAIRDEILREALCQ